MRGHHLVLLIEQVFVLVVVDTLVVVPNSVARAINPRILKRVKEELDRMLNQQKPSDFFDLVVFFRHGIWNSTQIKWWKVNTFDIIDKI